MANYLRAENISRHYGEKILFQGLTLSIESGQRLGLIARNGTGKTNLLQILCGREQPDSGTVVINKDISIAYLEQEPHLPSGMTVLDTLFNSNNQLLATIAKYEKALEHSEEDHSREALAELQHCIEAMDRLQAWDYEQRIKQILTKLQIHHFDQDVSTLSGGQRKRLALAGILLQQPDFVIMDEPTNHLDLEMIEWLEGFLKSSDMTLLLVTHDRYLMDQVCTGMIELENGTLYHHRGNYAYYLEKKADREFREEREIEKARNLMRKELDWMRRQPKARGTKSKSRIDAFYDLKEKADKKVVEQQVELHVKMNRLGGKVIEMQHISKSFQQGDRVIPIVQEFSYLFKPGERVGIVGRNGVGKSTFLNMLLGLEQPDSGKISRGDTVHFGYFSQQGATWKEDKRVIEVVKDIAEFVELDKGVKLTASQLCRRFLFDEKMQHTPVSNLSGGERRRLYLLTILMSNPNMLILDEPTNDLDIETLNVLEEFLETFKGSLIIVTHDRYFMDKLVDHLFIFEGEGKIRDFNGNYQDYLDERDEIRMEQTQEKAAIRNAGQTQQKIKKKFTFKEQTEYNNLSKEIEQLGKERGELEALLSKADLHYEEITEKANRLELVKSMIDEKEMRWLELDEMAGNS